MVGELVDDALKLVMNLLVEHAKLICVLQVLLDELEQLVAHFTVHEQG